MDHTISKDHTRGREEVEKRKLQTGVRPDVPIFPNQGMPPYTPDQYIPPLIESPILKTPEQQFQAYQAEQQAKQQSMIQQQEPLFVPTPPISPEMPSEIPLNYSSVHPIIPDTHMMRPPSSHTQQNGMRGMASTIPLQNTEQPFVNLRSHLRQQIAQQQQTATSNLQQAAAMVLTQEQGPSTSKQPPQGSLRPPFAMSHQGQASPGPQLYSPKKFLRERQNIASNTSLSPLEEIGLHSTAISEHITPNHVMNYETMSSCGNLIEEKFSRDRDPKQLSLEQVGIRTQHTVLNEQFQATGTQSPDELKMSRHFRKRNREENVSPEASILCAKLPRIDRTLGEPVISGLKDGSENENYHRYSPVPEIIGRVNHTSTNLNSLKELAPVAIEAHVPPASDNTELDIRRLSYACGEIPPGPEGHLAMFEQDSSRACLSSDRPSIQGAEIPSRMPSTCGRCEHLYTSLQYELQQKNIKIEELRNSSEMSQKRLPSRWLTVHRVQHEDFERLYEDTPQWTKIGVHDSLMGLHTIPRLKTFVKKHKGAEVAFLVFYSYELSGLEQDSGVLRSPHRIQPTSTQIQFLSSVLAKEFDALLQRNEILKRNVIFEDTYDDMDSDDEEDCGSSMVTNIDTTFYHFRSLIEGARGSFGKEEGQMLDLFIDFLVQEFDEKHGTVKHLFNQGLVTPATLKYLFKLEELVVFSEEKQIYGAELKSFVIESGSSMSISAESWAFDEMFYKNAIEKKLIAPQSMLEKRWAEITSLSCYPLSFADVKVREKLRKRGQRVWKCRRLAYVAYNGPNTKRDTGYTDTRFLIDMRTYQTMHGNRDLPQPPRDELEDHIMSKDEPPDHLVYMVPENIYAFDMQEKIWVDLEVDNISDIQWNKDAFKTLAIEEESKELVDALINNKIKADKATDPIVGKGNGLILLLHGGPGTGKTLTAESVAEIAEKPLYRVTCGDIGTEPRQVEEYLQKVFHLGKIWDCVVLLDEADVFLEQRTLSDLTRNALVSVFLRTLEYYDGILILTSNRVGTFDEAFKSRIQLALHYQNLNRCQREIIWTNFIDRLEKLGEKFDKKKIKDNIERLSEKAMNGRQIRNAITTARQLALFRGTRLSLEHLERSITVSLKFEKYLEEVHHQVKDEDRAREESLR